MSIITRCPECKTSFKVVPDQIKISDGWARCGRCQSVFDALANQVFVPTRPPEPVPAPPPAFTHQPVAPVAASSVAPQTISQPAQAFAATRPEPLTPPPAVRPVAPAPAASPSTPPQPVPLVPLRSVPAAPVHAPIQAPVQAPEAPVRASVLPDLDVDDGFSASAFHPQDFPRSSFGAEVAGAGVFRNPRSATPERVRDDFAQDLNAARTGSSRPAALEPAAEEVGHFGPSQWDDFGDTGQGTLSSAAAAAAPTHGREASNHGAAAPTAQGLDERDWDEDLSRPQADSMSPSAQPDFVRAAERAARWRSPKMRFFLGLLAFVLCLLLVGQWAWSYRDYVAASQPQLRPWLQQMCASVGCKIQAWRNIDAVQVEASSFNKVRDSQFRMSVSLRNTGRVPVATPSVQVMLNNEDGRALVRRVFSPAELGLPAQTLTGSEPYVGTALVEIRDNDIANSIMGYKMLTFYP